MQSRFLIFDIDGTLIHPGTGGKEAFLGAIEHSTGIRKVPDPSFSGRTDLGILTEILERTELVEQYRESIFAQYLQNLSRSFPETGEARVLDGVMILLETLESIGVKPGLVTGNIRLGARHKLTSLDLERFFFGGGFGDSHLDRFSLVEEAIQELERHHGCSPDQIEREAICIIGDTPEDILSARHHGCVSMAIATGRYTQDELAVHAPDALFASMTPEARAFILDFVRPSS